MNDREGVAIIPLQCRAKEDPTAYDMALNNLMRNGVIGSETILAGKKNGLNSFPPLGVFN